MSFNHLHCILKGYVSWDGFLSAEQALFLLQKLRHLELASDRLETNQSRQTERHLGVQHKTTDIHHDTDVDGRARDDCLHGHLLHDGDAVERALRFQSANANFELTVLNALDDVSNVADSIRALEQVDHGSGLGVSTAQPIALRRDDLRR